MKLEDKKRLVADLLRIAEETRQFKPYIPSRYLQDSYKYVLGPETREGAPEAAQPQ